MSVVSIDFFIFVTILVVVFLLTQLRDDHIPLWLRPYVTPVRPINIMLLLASYGFYAVFDWHFPLILIGVTVGVYLAALQNARSDTWRKVWLGIALGAGLGTLGLFKYYDFFIESFGGSMTLRLVLPVGLSFYSFQALSYSLDVHNRRIEPVSNIVSFALYMAFFPKLVSGPIERAQPFISDQIEATRRVSALQLEQGIFLILQGAFKKLAVANIIALALQDYLQAGRPFGEMPSGLLWVVMLLFTFQVYFDFAGYMDIARGTGKLFGFELSRNFAAPYFAARPVDFWNRWHITLSDWLRDYLFMPTARFMLRRTNRRLLVLGLAYLITMSLSGLWHGAGWNYVLWGAIHGAMLFGSRILLPGKLRDIQSVGDVALRALQIGVTFLLVNLAFVFFALPVGDALVFIRQLFAYNGFGATPLLTPALYAVTLWLLFDLSEVYVDRDKFALMYLPSPLRGAVYAVMFGLTVVSGLSFVQQFVYEAF